MEIDLAAMQARETTVSLLEYILDSNAPEAKKIEVFKQLKALQPRHNLVLNAEKNKVSYAVAAAQTETGIESIPGAVVDEEALPDIATPATSLVQASAPAAAAVSTMSTAITTTNDADIPVPRVQAPPSEENVNNNNDDNTAGTAAIAASPLQTVTQAASPVALVPSATSIDAAEVATQPVEPAEVPTPVPTKNYASTDKSINDILVRTAHSLTVNSLGEEISSEESYEAQKGSRTHKCKESNCSKHRYCPGRTRRQRIEQASTPTFQHDRSSRSATLLTKYEADRRTPATA